MSWRDTIGRGAVNLLTGRGRRSGGGGTLDRYRSQSGIVKLQDLDDEALEALGRAADRSGDQDSRYIIEAEKARRRGNAGARVPAGAAEADLRAERMRRASSKMKMGNVSARPVSSDTIGRGAVNLLTGRGRRSGGGGTLDRYRSQSGIVKLQDLDDEALEALGRAADRSGDQDSRYIIDAEKARRRGNAGAPTGAVNVWPTPPRNR